MNIMKVIIVFRTKLPMISALFCIQDECVNLCKISVSDLLPVNSNFVFAIIGCGELRVSKN